MTIRLKRVYEPVEEEDGYRVLVDRLWPRGISKSDAAIDLWLKEAAPSTALRQWFNHEPEKWDEFKARYFSELDDKMPILQQLLEAAEAGIVTLIYSSRDEAHNQAVALREYLEKLLDKR
ncbi:MAG TPA: DUF488 domain-containing protein [Oceanobacillus sp.]|nr:DUF488 domain-containing protein [Oceanobacillus sp.]